MAQTEKRNAVIYINGVEVNNTMSSIEKHARSLRNEIAHLTRGTDEYNKKVDELKATNKIIAGHRDNISGINRAWAEVKAQLKGAGAVMMAYLGGQAIIGGFRNLISKLGELDDALMDVAKTTGLSRNQLTELDKQLRTIKTRSSRMELLDLAKEAGKLGYNSVADIKRFVEQADKINVALGEDLGEGAITQIGKLANIFETDMLRIGSALNEVGAAGIASESWQVDYLTRLAGIAKTANLSLPDLLGYGAALEANGQTAEVSGTSLNQFFIDFIKNTEAFGQAAGFTKGELTKLIDENGTNAGFVAFLEKLKEGAVSSAELINKLDGLGVDGARASNVLLTLANNTSEVSRQQGIANKAFTDGTSITDEFNKKQQSFGATLATLQKWMAGVFMNNQLANGVRNMVTWFTNMVSPMKEVSEQLDEERLRLNSLVLTIANHNLSQEARKRAIDELKSTYPEFIKMVDVEKASNEELLSALKQVNEEYAKQIVIQRKGEEAAAQAQKQADALEKVIEQTNKYATASAQLKDALGLVQKAEESNQQFYDRVAKTVGALDQNDKRYYKSAKALEQLQYGVTGMYAAEKQLNIETKKFNDLLSAQNTLREKLLGPSTSDKIVNPITGGDIVAENTELDTMSKSIDKISSAIDDTSSKAEDIRQEIFLLMADDATKAMYDLDKFFEDLIIRAQQYGIPTEALYELWTQKSLELENQLKSTGDAAHEVFKKMSGTGGSNFKDNQDAAQAKRDSINAETEATIKLREEHEKYVESLFQAGAAAVENAETQQDAIKAVINAIREAIKQRIMEAIATTVGKALAELPFPLNVALATAAGAAATTLFDKLVPQAADGGYYTDVVGRQNGQKYRAQVNQRFMGGYAHQPMLVGEAGAEYTIPSFLMKNPYVVSMVDSIEGMRKGQSSNNSNNPVGIDLTEVIGRMDVMIQQMKEGKNVVMPDQTIKEFQKRLQLLEILSIIPFR